MTDRHANGVDSTELDSTEGDRLEGAIGEKASSKARPGGGAEAIGSTSSTVRVRGLQKIFYDEGRGEVRAVDGIDFDCRPGEIFGLLGANGAGKTTTLRMLATLLRPSAGEVRVMGHSVFDAAAEVRRHLGFHSASTALYPRLTARETLRFFASINRYPVPEIEQRVEALIARFDISSFADARVGKLSSGMKQKVSLARTLAHDPPILIFDEPTVGLDVLSALSLVETVRELRDEGKTILFSTHIMSEAEKLCDRIAILHGGRILVCDTLEGLRRRADAHYLEDIFVHYVGEADAATRAAVSGRRNEGSGSGAAGRETEPRAKGP